MRQRRIWTRLCASFGYTGKRIDWRRVMSLFGFGKKKEKKKESPEEFLARFNAEQGNWYEAFYFSHKAEIDLYDGQIADIRGQAKNAPTEQIRLQKLCECKAMLESFKTWCISQKGGTEYYEKHDKFGPDSKSYYEAILDEIRDIEYRNNTVIPAIIEAASREGGIIQTELYKEINYDKNIVRDMIYHLEQEGRVTREKKGNSYIVRAAK